MCVLAAHFIKLKELLPVPCVFEAVGFFFPSLFSLFYCLHRNSLDNWMTWFTVT